MKECCNKTAEKIFEDIEGLDFVKIWTNSEVETAFKRQWGLLKKQWKVDK